MLALQKATLDHGRSSDTATQRDHYRVFATLRGAIGGLSQQRKPRIIFKQEGQRKLVCAPLLQIDGGGVAELPIGCQYAFLAGIYDAAKAKHDGRTPVRPQAGQLLTMAERCGNRGEQIS